MTSTDLTDLARGATKLIVLTARGHRQLRTLLTKLLAEGG